MSTTTLDLVQCGVVVLSSGLVVLEANAMFCAMVDRATDDVIGAPIESFLTAPARIFVHTNVFPSVRLSGSVSEAYLSLRSTSGQTVPVLMNAAVRTDAAGSVLDCAFVRISQRDRWEEETHRARRAAEDERDRHRETSARLAEALSSLQASVEEVNRNHWLLERVAEVLPICMGCARVRAGQDWESVADFLRSHSSFLSHGYCPECAATAAAEWGIELPSSSDGG